jgi:signal transduction histidine kinase
VGTLLTRALYMTKSDTDSPERPLKQTIQEALYSLRIYIQTLQRHEFPISRLTDEIRELFFKSLRTSGIEVSANVKSDREYLLGAELYRDLRLCLFEACTNILKHSGAKRVQLSISAVQGWLEIIIEDDGSATNTVELTEKGNGIQNQAERIRAHKGEISLSINPSGHGLRTLIRLRLRD